jgi:peptide/nickel transport system substrate-binding protein
MRRGFKLLALLLGLSLIVASCGDDDDDPGGTASTDEGGTGDVEEGGTIVYAAEQAPTGFNNLTAKDNLLELRHIMRHIWPYAYRAKPDLTLEPMPVLAAPAEIVSEDPFTVEWTIAEDAIWNDDTPVTSADFEWVWLSCNGAIDEGEPTATDEASGETITGIDCAATSGYDASTFETVDDKTFRLVFEGPYYEYEGLFGDPLPPSHLGKEAEGGWNTGFDADPLASAGPYQLKEWVRGDHITIEKNPKWWGPEPNLDEIVFKLIENPAEHPDALRNDEVQLAYPQPQVDLLDQLGSIDGVHHEVNFGPTWEHLDFNFQNELLAMKEVRQAIAYGIDRDRYVDTLMKPLSEDAERLDSYVYVANNENYEPKGDEYSERSVEKATAALEDAGFEMGGDGIYALDGEKASFRLRVLSPNPLREELEQLIQADLKEVGIDVVIENFSEPDTIGGIGVAGDFDLFIFAWVGTPFPVSGAAQSYGTGSDSNFGKYSNPEFDDLVSQASQVPIDEAADLLNQADEILWEDLPSIPLFQKPAGVLSYADRYANIVDNTSSEGLFWNSETWGIRATA